MNHCWLWGCNRPSGVNHFTEIEMQSNHSWELIARSITGNTTSTRLRQTCSNPKSTRLAIPINRSTAIDSLSTSASLKTRFATRGGFLSPCTSELQKATFPLTNSDHLFEGKAQTNWCVCPCLFQNLELKEISRFEVQHTTKLQMFSFVAQRTLSNAALP